MLYRVISLLDVRYPKHLYRLSKIESKERSMVMKATRQ